MSRFAMTAIRLVLLPVVLLRSVVRVFYRALRTILSPATGLVDSSERLSRLINSLSSSMATQRGLLLMVGIGTVLLSLLTHGVVLAVLVATDYLDRVLLWLCIPATMLHGGILAGFIGILLAVPLGQGYKSQQ